MRLNTRKRLLLVTMACTAGAIFWHTHSFPAPKLSADACAPAAAAAGQIDPRDVCSGKRMLSRADAARFKYADQPSCAVVDVGGAQTEWLCVVTLSEADEGQNPAQFAAALHTTDGGLTFSSPQPISTDAPSSWCVPFRLNSGAVAVFYTWNSDPAFDDSKVRLDMAGKLVVRMSTDVGDTWSERQIVEQRRTSCDLTNPFHGSTLVGWSVNPPIALRDGSILLQGSKICGGRSWEQRGMAKPSAFMWESQVFFYQAHRGMNSSPDTWAWETLPEGDVGLRHRPTGEGLGWINEEGAVLELSNGNLCSYFRTAEGWLGERCSQSIRNWPDNTDGFARFAPTRLHGNTIGRQIKNPRGPVTPFKTSRGLFLMTFYNRGHPVEEDTYFPAHPGDFKHRDVLWLVGGREREDGAGIDWGPHPEIALYATDAAVRLGYVGMHESQDRIYLTLTDKKEPTLHMLDASFLSAVLFDQHSTEDIARELDDVGNGVIQRSWPGDELRLPKISANTPGSQRAGFTLELWATVAAATELMHQQSRTLLSAIQSDEQCAQRCASAPAKSLRQTCLSDKSGVKMLWVPAHATTYLSVPPTIRFVVMICGTVVLQYEPDPDCSARLHASSGRAGPSTQELHQIALVFDGAAQIVRFVIDGEQCDGGTHNSSGFLAFRSPSATSSLDLQNMHHYLLGQQVEIWQSRTADLDVKSVRLVEAAVRGAHLLARFLTLA